MQHAQLPRLLYGCSSMQNSGLQNRKMRVHVLPPVPNAGSLPPVKARRRKNTIDNLNAVSKAASRSGARRDGRPQRDFESLKKSARHLLVRTPLLTQLRIAETHNIKAETAGLCGIPRDSPPALCGQYRESKKQAYHHAHSTGCRLLRCGLAICNG